MPICGGKQCDTCTIKIKIDKLIPCCKCGKWSDETVIITWNDGKPQKGSISCNSSKPFPIPMACAGKQISGTFGIYVCDPPDCQVKYNWTVTNPGGIQVGNGVGVTSNAYTFTPLTPGMYTLVIKAFCGDKLCGECKVVINIIKMDKCE
jgi:hypothetical protein